jgi:predicted PurR-regulated permease PerM
LDLSDKTAPPLARDDEDTDSRRPDRGPVLVAVTPKAVVVWIAITTGAVLLLTLGYLALDAITWVLVAALFAMALNPAVEALVRRGLGRGYAAAGVFVGASAAFGALGFLIVPPLITATTDFLEALPGYLRELDAGRGPLAFLERRFHVGEELVDVYERGGLAALFGLERPGADAARAAAGTALALIAVPFLTFFMLLDGKRWVEGFVDLMPPDARPRWKRTFDGVYRTVGGYVTGNLLISLVAGTVAAVTLLTVGAPYALPLAVVVAVLDLVPLVGATIAIAVCGLAALTQGPIVAVIVVVILLLYQQIENHVLLPVVYGRTVDLSPLAVLIALLVGADLAGVVGALAAIPVAGSLAVIARELARWKRESSLHLPRTVEQQRHDEPT